MEKFGMSFGGTSRKDLLETIEAQKKQLVQYQTRFRDVVQAYKSLLKEKEALESSLQVLTGSSLQVQTGSSQQVQTGSSLQVQTGSQQAEPQDPPDDRSSPHSEASVDSPETARDQTEEDHGGPGGPPRPETGGCEGGGAEDQQAAPPGGSEADRRVAQLKNQLSTLSGAVATVTQEKSRMEAGFQADRRQLRQEVEDLQDRLVAMTTQHETETRILQDQLAESRARIITQQHDRELEQRDHVLQLQELTRILQDQDQDQARPDPRVDQLQRELLDLKNQIQDQVHSETRRACQAEERARERAQAAELRVAGLEQRLSELSELLGSSEKTKQRDQQVVQRLRDRILQLDTENKMLAMATAGRATSDPDEAQLDVAALKEKMEKVKKLLLLAAQKNPDQAPLILKLAQSEPVQQEPGQQEAVQQEAGQQEAGQQEAGQQEAGQQELQQLRDEFERYKLRAQVVLKNKNARDGCQARELEEVRDQLAELKEKYINLRIQSDEAEAEQRRRLEERTQRAAELQQSHRQEAERVAALHREELLRLEAELHKQRERTMALLDEKDQELERLRAAAPTPDAPRCAAEASEDDGAAAESEGDMVSRALRQAAHAEPTLLLYAEQLARKEAEAGALRRHKHQLEEDVHQLQAKLIANAERHDEEAAELRAGLDKLMRDQNREGANMEYLKNVVYRFLTLPDAGGRQQTLGAILTILHFSPQEKLAVGRLQGATWWSPSNR
ncbi:GRIP and coiled-coil domain-containing protein 1 [Scomber japonicus]|uniref:GRIP and coiled-coil domain-containing protein 1 n=1 Tax=Scomber japonicus TaxID=13676 RepID=UPI00230514D8|nr:GRIP and coiled-coil domain-containing protein 1 [Scomber japonicus]